MTWESTTSDADPGAGKIAFNNATLGSVSILYVDDADDASANIQPYVDSWDAVSNSTARGIVTVVKEGTASTYAVFKVSGAVTDASGYSKIPVTHVVSAGSFSDDDGVGVHFSYSGADAGSTDLVNDTSPQLGGTLDCNSQAIDLQGLADGLILDGDTDTTISSPTDDQIDFELGGSDLYRMTATGLTGKILNTVTAIATGQQSISSTSYADLTGATADITCQSTSSKVLVIIACSHYGANSFATVLRDTTDLAGNSDGVIQTSAASFQNGPMVFLDSPSSTSALTYKVQMKNSTGTTYSGWSSGATKCTITLIECAAGV
jgi:hypothetical protein